MTFTASPCAGFLFTRRFLREVFQLEIPIYEKYVLSVEEAALYFHIGVNRLRKLIKEHKDADWVLWNQTHVYIKRKKFEQYIDSINAI